MPTHNELSDSLLSKHYRWLRQRVSYDMRCEYRAEDIAADTFVRVLGLPDLAACSPQTLMFHPPQTDLATTVRIKSMRQHTIAKALEIERFTVDLSR